MPQPKPSIEIKVARAKPVIEKAFPNDTVPKLMFPPPSKKLWVQKPEALKTKPAEKFESMEQTTKTPPPQEKFKDTTQTEFAHLSPPSTGGAGKRKAPAKGEAVPMTAASYSIGAQGNKPPDYPERARRNEFEGRVVLRVQVMPDGTGGNIKVLQSSGYGILDHAALAAVEKWQFIPAKRVETAISAYLDVPITFRLAGPKN